MNTQALDKELKYFAQHKAEYLKVYKVTYVVIKNDKLLGNFTNQNEAYAAGIKEYGNVPFLIKLVTENEASPIHAPAITLV
jgi:hypothetical protein